jgi:hypothetical protein
MTSHIPDQIEQMVRYGDCPLFGSFYSNVSRGLRQKENQDALIPCVIEPVKSLKVERVIDKILGHWGLCQKTQRPPPKPKTLELQIIPPYL